MLAIVPSATLHGLDGRFIRVEVDVAPGPARVHHRRAGRRGAPGGTRARPRRAAQCRVRPSAAPDHGQSGAGRPAQGAAPRSTSRWRSASCSARSRSAPDRGASALIGELSLGGEVRAVPGVLPMVAALARRGAATGRRGRRGRRRRGTARRRDGGGRRGHACGRGRGHPCAAGAAGRGRPADGSSWSSRRRGRRMTATGHRVPGGPAAPDLGEVRGQVEARRGLEIALAGGHGLLLIGPPGSGKTLLARTIPGLLPPLDDAAALAATVVASAAGEGPIAALRRRPPFRAPHHTVSYAAMVGGGPHLSPGEITLADHGVLFLDELPEFGTRRARGAPPADGGGPGRDRARRARDDVPGPVPAGRGDEPVSVRLRRASDRPCGCPPRVPERYQRRVSGPLRDRIDLWIAMPRVAPLALVGGPSRRRRRRSRRGSRRPGASASAGAPGVLNGRLTRAAAAAPRAGCRAAAERRVVAPRRARTGQRARARSGCSGWRGRSPTSRAADASASDTSTRPPGSGRRTCGWPPPRPADARRRARRTARRGRTRPATRRDAAPAPPGPATRNATRGPCWPAFAASGRSGSGRCSARYGAAAAILREAASPGGLDRLAAVDPDEADDARGSRRRRRAPSVADGDRRGRPRPAATLDRIRGARSAHRDDRGSRVSRAAGRDRDAAARAVRRSAIRRRSARARRSPSSAPAGRPMPGGRIAARIAARPRGRRRERRLGAGGRDRRCRARGGASTPGHDRGGHRARPCRPPSPRSQPAGRRDRRRRRRDRVRARTGRRPEPRDVPAPQPDHQRAGRRDRRRRGAGPERRADHRVLGARAGSRVLPRPRRRSTPRRRPAVSRSCASSRTAPGSWPASRS